jgi:transposase
MASPRSAAAVAAHASARPSCTPTRPTTTPPSVALGRRGILIRIARKGIESSQRLGRHRWIIEACLSWLLRYRRLVRRYDRKAAHFQAFADLACALVCFRRLTRITK